MAIKATKVVNRDIYAISYDGASGAGIANVRMENPETGDVSTTQTKDDGEFNVSVGVGYEGTADVVITNHAGEEIDSGTVSYGGDEVDEPDKPPVDPSLHPEHPIVLPTPPDGSLPHPAHPIELPDSEPKADE